MNYLSDHPVSLNFVPFRCELTMTEVNPTVSVNDIFNVIAEFSSKNGEFVKKKSVQ